MTREAHLASVIEAIGVMTREFNARGSYPFKDRSLRRAQMDLLFALSRRDALSVGGLAAELRVTSGAVSQVVDGLRAVGLVTNDVNPADSRGRIIRLTDIARHEVDAFQQDYITSLAPRFDALSAAEVAELDRLLGKLSTSATVTAIASVSIASRSSVSLSTSREQE